MIGVDEADNDRSVVLGNSGIVLTARISEPSARDGDGRTLGMDNVLGFVLDEVL